MKKQDKLFSLLKRNGWEQTDTIECEGINIRFRIYEYHDNNAHNDYHPQRIQILAQKQPADACADSIPHC